MFPLIQKNDLNLEKAEKFVKIIYNNDKYRTSIIYDSMNDYGLKPVRMNRDGIKTLIPEIIIDGYKIYYSERLVIIDIDGSDNAVYCVKVNGMSKYNLIDKLNDMINTHIFNIVESIQTILQNSEDACFSVTIEKWSETSK